MLFTRNEINTYKLYSETFEIINAIYDRVGFEGTEYTLEFSFFFEKDENFKSFFLDLKEGLICLHHLIYMYDSDIKKHEEAVEKLNINLRNIKIGMITKAEYWIITSFFDALLSYFREVFVDLRFYNRVSDSSSEEEKKLYHVANKILNIWSDKGQSNKLRSIENNKIRLADLEERLSAIKKSIENFEYNQTTRIEKFITEARKKVNDEVSSTSKNFQLQVDNFFNTIDQDVINKVGELRSKLNTTETELSNLGIGVKAYNSIVSEKVENEFAKYYLIKAKEEKKIYYGITITSICLLVGSIVLAWFSLTKYYNNYVDPKGLKNTIKDLNPMEVEWVQQAAFLYLSLRLVISILIFLSVIYTGRIAYRAYLHWRHSENTHLKLASLRPFINDLSLEDIAQIRKDLIPDFFGKDAGNIDGTNESFKDLPTNVSALAAKAIEQIGNNIGTKSTTEKNTKNQTGGTE